MKIKYLMMCVVGMAMATHAGLVGYWDFEGGSTSTLIDQSGNGNDAAVQAGGTLQYSADTPTLLGSSLLLDGTPSTSAEALSSDSLSITGSMSMVAWVKLDAAASSNGVYQILSKGASDYRWQLQDLNLSTGGFNQLAVVALDTDIRNGNGSILTQWLHLAVVYDEAAQTKAFYRNGVFLESFASTNALLGTAQSLQVGALKTNDLSAVFNVMHGLMDDVAIYDQALSGTQVANLANGSKTPATVLIPDEAEPTYENLVGYWDFEDTSTTLLHDQSGRGNQAVAPIGGTLTYSNDTPFAVGKSLSLDGTNGWASAADSDSLSVTGSVSLVAWVKLSSSGAADYGEILSKNHAAYRWRIKNINYGNGNFRAQAFINWDEDRNFINGSPGSWMHLAMVYDEAAQTKSFYRNGVLDDESPVASTNALLATAHNLAIGTFLNDSSVSSGTFNGLLDDVAIYSTALSAAQIASLADGSQTPTTIVPAEALPPAAPATFIGIAFVSGGVMEMTVNAPSSAARYYPESRADLTLGTWEKVPHSDNAGGPFVVSNLSYSTATGTNEVIYIEAPHAASFFRIEGEGQ